MDKEALFKSLERLEQNIHYDIDIIKPRDLVTENRVYLVFATIMVFLSGLGLYLCFGVAGDNQNVFKIFTFFGFGFGLLTLVLTSFLKTMIQDDPIIKHLLVGIVCSFTILVPLAFVCAFFPDTPYKYSLVAYNPFQMSISTIIFLVTVAIQVILLSFSYKKNLLHFFLSYSIFLVILLFGIMHLT